MNVSVPGQSSVGGWGWVHNRAPCCLPGQLGLWRRSSLLRQRRLEHMYPWAPHQIGSYFKEGLLVVTHTVLCPVHSEGCASAAATNHSRRAAVPGATHANSRSTVDRCSRCTRQAHSVLAKLCCLGALSFFCRKSRDKADELLLLLLGRAVYADAEATYTASTIPNRLHAMHAEHTASTMCLHCNRLPAVVTPSTGSRA